MGIKDERGVTLVEMLAAIVITAIIGIIGYNVLFSGISAYEQAKIETELRDEADIIMAMMLNELYTTKLSEINETVFEDGNYYFTVNGQKIGFENNVPIVLDRPIILNRDIIISNETRIEGYKIKNRRYDFSSDIEKQYIDNLYEITIVLEKAGTDQRLETTSRISIINDTNYQREGEADGQH